MTPRLATGPDLLASTVLARTKLPSRYLDHAAHQGMTVYLADWEEAHRRLGEAIEQLRAARDERRSATDEGRWP